MAGMHEDHIRWQCDPKKPVKIKRITINEETTPDEPMGPKGSVINYPADYDAGFKILKEWVDSEGGPPEDVRMRLRELFMSLLKNLIFPSTTNIISASLSCL